MSTVDPSAGFLRLIYTSTAVGDHYRSILQVSQANNGIDGISGLLAYKNGRFVQVLEGPPDSVRDAFERIRCDPRHADVDVVSSDLVEERAFGSWTMAALPGDSEELVRSRLSWLLRSAPPEVSAAFAEH